MGRYTAHLIWTRDDAPFLDRRYSRVHRLCFDGGLEVPGSSSPLVVRAPMSDPAALDPEEAFVASLASCHMLWFLDLACTAGWCVDAYDDPAEGVLAKDGNGRMAMTLVTLRPHTVFAGDRQPDRAELLRLHHQAHEACFIANSVRTELRCEPR